MPGPRLQDPIPLTSHPITVTLQSAAKKANKNTTAKKDAPSSTIPFYAICEPVYLNKSEGETDLSVLTIQGEGIHLYKTATQQSIHSRSVAPSTIFACPAAFLETTTEQLPTSNATDLITPRHSDAEDGDEVDEETNSIQDPEAQLIVSGTLFAALDKSTDLSASDERKTIIAWDIQHNNTTSTNSKPAAQQSLDEPIYGLYPIRGTNYLLVLHKNGGLTIVSRSLKTLVKASPEHPVQVKFVKFDALTSELSMIVKNKYGKFGIRLFRVTIDDVEKKPLLEMVKDLDLSLSRKETPLVWSVSNEGAVAALLATQQIAVFRMDASQCTHDKFTLVAEQSSTTNNNNTNSKSNDAFIHLSSDYIAHISPNSTTLTIYDTRYGTPQFSTSLDIRNIHQVSLMNSSITGPQLIFSSTEPTATSRGNKSSNKDSFAVTASILPFFVPTLNLLSCMGRMSDSTTSTAFTHPTEIQINPDGTTQPRRNQTETEVINKLMDAIQRKDVSTLDEQAVDNAVKSVSSVLALNALMDAIVSAHESKPTFFPKDLIKRLLNTQCITSSKIILQSVAQNQWNLVSVGLAKVTEISEQDLVKILRGTIAHNENKQSCAQIFAEIFGRKFSDGFMVFALKVLSVEELEVVLGWLGNVFTSGNASNEDVKENEPCWWMFSKSKYEKMFQMALNTISLLLDAHFSTILLTPALHTHFLTIRPYIKETIETLESMQDLIGILSQFDRKASRTSITQKISNTSEGAEKVDGRQRWKRMLGQMGDGVGAYRVEVFHL